MLKIDYAGCLSTRVGPEHGIDPSLLGELAEEVRGHTAALERTRGTGWERWRLLADPSGTRGRYEASVREAAGRHRGRWESLVVLGIGGSALGNIALQAALNPPMYNLLPLERRSGPRVFVIDNADPVVFASVMSVIDPRTTLFNVISKSGETAETAAQFMIVREMLRGAVERPAGQVVAVTDAKSGTMRAICDAEGYDTLEVPEGVGGRFSVLSPVGLFSAAMAGIDIGALLDGAHEMETRCRAAEMRENPAATLAAVLVQLGARHRAPKPNHVLMPYANGLYLLADWYRQLWAESLGKRFAADGREVYAGFTPIKALGATDQHSQVQLYREGPNDKVIGLVGVEDFGEGHRPVRMPRGLGVAALSYLEGRSMAELLNAEKRATEYALMESQRPCYTIGFPRVDAFHVGAFVMLWQVATAYAGRMLGVDAYDQPAVETGKKATFGLMGREGYGEWEARVNGALGPTPYVV